MADIIGNEPMLDLFVFETLQLIEQLEQSVLEGEKSNGIEASINEIFRIMHTIKGSAAMMMFNGISSLAHSLEDLFFFIRENSPEEIDYTSLTDIVLEGIDFIKNEVDKIEKGRDCDGDSSELSKIIKEYLDRIKLLNNCNEVCDQKATQVEVKHNYYISSKQYTSEKNTNSYFAHVFFEDDCGMENVRAFEIIHRLSDIAFEIDHNPKDLFDEEKSTEIIVNEGFKVYFNSEKTLEDIRLFLLDTIFLRSLNLELIKQNKTIDLDENEIIKDKYIAKKTIKERNEKESAITSSKASLISVNVSKLDLLMDIVGELVISQALVTQHPELMGLPLNDFYKAARQLKKNTNELQDIVMSIRMVALSGTFQKMKRLVRDMSKKLGKEVNLEIIGEETEVDKNIIEHISDPLMHLIRNSIDHGIESSEERLTAGKDKVGNITLEAKNSGGDVWIIVKDDGKGLNREKILDKAKENGLLNKPEDELTDKEVYSFILHPGFSTKDNISEFSGRGVGMDVVFKNIEKIRGTLSIDSSMGIGTSIIIKIPLTLAIVDGMNIQVGSSKYTIPIISIKESFRINPEQVVTDTTGNEMILLRGECFPIVRLYEFYNINTEITDLEEGIMILVENETQKVCIFADILLGEQQVVVKALPNYIKKVKGVGGCTLLGDGSISLILDVTEFINSI